MDIHNIVGIQQISIGTGDIDESCKWYADLFQMNVKAFEDTVTADFLQSLSGKSSQEHRVCLTLNLQGGGGFELWQIDADQQPRNQEILIGDTGILMAKIKSHNIAAYHEELSQKHQLISPIFTDPRGLPTFYINDPFGNYFQVVEDNYVFLDEGHYSGGIVGAVIGVSDIDRSLPLYQDILGYDTIVYDKTGIYNDWQTLKGGSGQFRRMLIKRSAPLKGPFAGLYGNSMIELVQCTDRTPNKIHSENQWCSEGFMFLSFDVTNMADFKELCNKKGYSFTLISDNENTPFKTKRVSGQFSFLEDPDGTRIEFVEIQKIPLISKLDISINLQKIDQEKQLPELLFYLMKLNKVKFK